MPYGQDLLVLLDRRVLGAREANDLIKVKALWCLPCHVNNVLEVASIKGRAASNNLLCIISCPIVPSGMEGPWVRRAERQAWPVHCQVSSGEEASPVYRKCGTRLRPPPCLQRGVPLV